jgi:hypothetical protein
VSHVPRDHKRRPSWQQLDLVAGQPTQAFASPAGLNSQELAWFLETKDYRRWQAIEKRFVWALRAPSGA